MTVRVTIIAALVCGLAASVSAGEGALRVDVSNSNPEVGQVFNIIVEAEGRKLGEIQMPQVDGLRIDPRPSIQRSSFSAVLGKSQKFTQVLGFNAVAEKTGKITISPLSMEIDGQTVMSEPLVVDVAAAGTAPPSPLPGHAAPENEESAAQLHVEDVAYVKAEVDKTEVYVGEPVSLTLMFFRIDERAVRVSAPEGGIEMTFPETEGFYSIPERPEEIDGALAEEEGRRYSVARWRQTLFATNAGDLTIPSWEWRAGVSAHTLRGPFSAALELRTEPIDIKVKPLPKRPPNFNGAVGQFTLEAQVTPQITKQNMPIALVVRVNGTGNPAAIAEPALPELVNAHISEPERAIQPIMDPEGVTAETMFSYKITPLEPGSLAVPPIEFCYFDPAKEQFVTEKTQAFLVTVQDSGEKERRYVAGTAIESPQRMDITESGIMPIVTAPGGLRRSADARPGLAMILAGPPLAYGALLVWTARKRRFAEDRTFARSYRAKSRMQKRLRRALESADPADALYRAINGYIADKFDLPEAGMTSTDAQDLLEGRAINHEAAESLVEILRVCERGRYARQPLGRREVESLVEQAQANMDDFDQWLRRESR